MQSALAPRRIHPKHSVEGLGLCTCFTQRRPLIRCRRRNHIHLVPWLPYRPPVDCESRWPAPGQRRQRPCAGSRRAQGWTDNRRRQSRQRLPGRPTVVILNARPRTCSRYSRLAMSRCYASALPPTVWIKSLQAMARPVRSGRWWRRPKLRAAAFARCHAACSRISAWPE